ncbi:protein arv1 homolog [Coffea eugenioides]|uniref:protein arv1 homolog n=1 Tax=Coffea eugenioides TaxID=49369 RepID=UPI000F60A6F0|nr:protein arv1 homolog [Coffea eugenioides]
MEKKSDFRCVECSFPIKSLYIQYSPGNIRLMKCGNCKKVADEYIECEVMIILIDLILHKPKAYRHLFYNMFTRDILDFECLMWKLLLGFLMLDSYRIWVLNVNDSESISLMSFAAVLRFSGKVLIDVVLGNFLFMSVVLIGSAKFLMNTSVGVLECKDTVLTMLVSSYFKIFLIAMMVWEFPSSMIIMIDMFVLSSNTVALKVIANSATIRCFGVCFAAHAVKFFVSEWLRKLHLS